jgi:hypothetical protein
MCNLHVIMYVSCVLVCGCIMPYSFKCVVEAALSSRDKYGPQKRSDWEIKGRTNYWNCFLWPNRPEPKWKKKQTEDSQDLREIFRRSHFPFDSHVLTSSLCIHFLTRSLLKSAGPLSTKKKEIFKQKSFFFPMGSPTQKVEYFLCTH